jgi:pimeloyl-ACP methyl ester carboxylesterase
MGARIAVELAANYEGRVSHLLLLDGSNVPEDPNVAMSRLSKELAQFGQQAWAEAAFKSMMIDNLDLDQKHNIVHRAAQYPADVLMAYYYAMASWDRDNFVAAVDKLTCPVTIFQATSLDKNEVRQFVINNPKSLWLDVLRARIPSVMIKLVPNTGHFIMFEQPKLIADWVKKVLQF